MAELKGLPYPVVTTAAEAIEYLKKGCGVGIDCTDKTKEEAEEIMRLTREYQATGVRQRASMNLYLVPQPKYNEPWVAVETREDLGRGGSTRVMMFVRGVGMRLGIMTVLFEKPWKVIDPDWFGPERDLELNDVACYISLENFPWPNNHRP